MGRKRLLGLLAATVVLVVPAPAVALDGVTQVTDATEAVMTSSTDTLTSASSDTTVGDAVEQTTSDTTAEQDGAEGGTQVALPVPGVGEVTVAVDADPEEPALEISVGAETEDPTTGEDITPGVTVRLDPSGPSLDVDPDGTPLDEPDADGAPAGGPSVNLRGPSRDQVHQASASTGTVEFEMATLASEGRSAPTRRYGGSSRPDVDETVPSIASPQVADPAPVTEVAAPAAAPAPTPSSDQHTLLKLLAALLVAVAAVTQRGVARQVGERA